MERILYDTFDMGKDREPSSSGLHYTENQFGTIYPQGFKVEDVSTRMMRENLERWQDSVGLPKSRERIFIERFDEPETPTTVLDGNE